MIIRDAVETDLPVIVIYNAAIPNRMAASDLEPVSVESRFCWFSEHTQLPPYLGDGSRPRSLRLSFQSFYYERSATRRLLRLVPYCCSQPIALRVRAALPPAAG